MCCVFARISRPWILSSILLLLIAHGARCERLPLRSYSTADGLSNNQVNMIVRDSLGFLWFCTADGLSLFDWYEFTSYGADQGLPHPYVDSLLETKEGEYWVG